MLQHRLEKVFRLASNRILIGGLSEGDAMLLKRSSAAVLAAALVAAGSCIVSVADAATITHKTTGIQSARSVTRMNLRRIAHGHYGTLIGRWVEAAHGTNAFGGKGLRPGGTDRLSVYARKIVDGSIVVRGETLSDGQGLKNAKLVFTRSDKYLTASLKKQSVAINYVVEFYPRRVPLHLMTSRNGVKIPRSKNRIVIWTSNNSYTEVFSEK